MNLGLRDTLAFFRDRSVPPWSRLLGLVAIGYVLSPVDLSPDVVPIVGWLDDMGVVAVITAYYVRKIGGYRAQRALSAKDGA
ncbi:MAG TPA: hypothetical protein DFS52_23370 [Myxococcales bacterium]|jgi:uncharacterized membrane protein YkvA (DUF1232 family)|nr:hypothetical protein [Myxococcales bacterium]